MRLGRVGDKAQLRLGQRVHLGAGGEIVGALRAAVEHDDQRQRLTVIATGDIQLVAAGADVVGI